MAMTQLKHDYTIIESYPNILFESIIIYNKYLETHTEKESDKYIKQWTTKRAIECIEKDLQDGIIKELPDNWKEDYINKLT